MIQQQSMYAKSVHAETGKQAVAEQKCFQNLVHELLLRMKASMSDDQGLSNSQVPASGLLSEKDGSKGHEVVEYQ
jgi:altronate dehydratase